MGRSDSGEIEEAMDRLLAPDFMAAGIPADGIGDDDSRKS